MSTRGSRTCCYVDKTTGVGAVPASDAELTAQPCGYWTSSRSYTDSVTARGTDWGLAALVALLIATGVLTFFAGGSGDAWVFAAHDALGVAIGLLLIVKLRRVWSRVAALARWDRRTIVGVGGLVLATAALGSGLLWAGGVTPQLAGYDLLAWHDAFGAVLAVAVAAHMVARAKPLRWRDVAHRRQFLAAAGIAAGSLVAWRTQRPLQALFGLRGAKRRFTGSYEAGSFAGNAFPTTSWVADSPRPIQLDSYRLRVGGLVDHELSLPLAELVARDEVIEVLDCTGGFYSTQRWRGVRLDRVLHRAGAQTRARHVSVVSRTGYRWSFAIQDAPGLFFATHVGEQRLSHEHGAPVRLVVPGARGFLWVKWVERVELRRDPDYGAPASTVWSSLTRAGRGEA
jgi:DMSO/TMAO reductase YedYZ molybdopterin-dependent catalytic subunit